MSTAAEHAAHVLVLAYWDPRVFPLQECNNEKAPQSPLLLSDQPVEAHGDLHE